MLEFIWGLKTTAMFDLWTLEHFSAGLSIGSIVKKKTKKELQNVNKKVDDNYKTAIKFSVLGVLFCAYIWEAAEHYFEKGLIGNWWENWFYGVEFWPNRLIADPLILVIGYFFVLKYPWLKWPARVFSFTWIFINIFLVPHSMTIQQWLMFG